MHSAIQLWKCSSFVSAYLRKKQTHIHNFSLIAPNIAELAFNGGADEPAFAIAIAVQTIKKTEVGEDSDKIRNIWTHAIFLIYHIGENECSDESALLLWEDKCSNKQKNKTSIM